MILRRLGVATAMLVAAAPPVQACSVGPDYRVPTNLDLAVQGDTIVVAEVVGRRTVGDRKSGDFDSTVFARPIHFIKGRQAPRLIALKRAYLSDDPRGVTPSAPRELRESNPDAWMGGCSRYAFRKGMKLVLFLKRDAHGRYTPYRNAFARDSEDVSGPDALWVKAVREYAAISEAPPAERNARLRRRIRELRARREDRDAQAIARDMAVELKMRTRGRPSLFR